MVKLTARQKMLATIDEHGEVSTNQLIKAAECRRNVAYTLIGRMLAAGDIGYREEDHPENGMTKLWRRTSTGGTITVQSLSPESLAQTMQSMDWPVPTEPVDEWWLERAQDICNELANVEPEPS